MVMIIYLIIIIFILLIIYSFIKYKFHTDNLISNSLKMKNNNNLIWELTYISKDANVLILDEPYEYIQNFLNDFLIKDLKNTNIDTLIIQNFNMIKNVDLSNIKTILSKEKLELNQFTEKIKSTNYYIYEKYQNVPKIIWSYWNEETLPELNQLCVSSWRQNLNNEWKINVLNSKNIEQYININNKDKFNKLSVTLQSDIIRLKLLYDYGGVWVDNTIFINSNLNEFINNMNKLDLLFLIKNKNVDKIIKSWENYFLVARPRSSTVLTILNKLEKVLYEKEEYNSLNINQLISLRLNNEYHLVYVIHLNECYNNANVYFNTINQKYSRCISTNNEMMYNDLFNYIILQHINKYKYQNNFDENIIKLFPILKIINQQRNYFNKMYQTNNIKNFTYEDILKDREKCT